jgi:serpin B
MEKSIFLCAVLVTMQALAAETNTDIAAKAINTLGIELLVKATKPNENTVISPYSIQSALAMAYAGAEGQTRAEMAKALHYPNDDAEVHRSFAALRNALDEVAKKSADQAAQMKKWGGTNDPITLAVANRLFGQSGYDIRAPFLSLVKDNYAAPFEGLDFAKDAAGATRHINVWVEEQTRQRIRNVVPDGALNDLTRLVLVNAIYLKAPWVEPFNASQTKPGPFHVNGGKSVDVPMMMQRHEFAFRRGDGFIVVALPYQSYQLRFLIVLPDKADGLDALQARLSHEVLPEQAKWEERDVTLYLPKFKLEPPLLPLGAVLRSLGMKTAFDQPRGSANFDRIAPRRPNDYLYISEVFHKTFFNLDEKGTEAAAATAIHVMTLGIHEPKKPIEVRVDHPFLFAIQHGPSGACLFLGRVVDPR